MKLEELKENIKSQFKEVSDALFKGTITLQEIETSKRVFAETSTMFGGNFVRYSESNFEYFYGIQKYFCIYLNMLDLRVTTRDFVKLKIADDLLSLKFIDQLSFCKESEVPNDLLFVEYNFISNLFVFLHECGHLNQQQAKESENIEANHFSEFNADYYSITKLLQYYYTLKKEFPKIYNQKIQLFGNEHNLIRLVIVTALNFVFFEILPKFESGDSDTHPAIRKRFCYLIVQSIQQINQNFKDLFIIDRLNDFIVDIFSTMHFIEAVSFEKKEFVFDNLLNFCFSDFGEIQKHLESSKEFKDFNK